MYALPRAADLEGDSQELHLLTETWVMGMRKPPNKDIKELTRTAVPCFNRAVADQSAIASAAVGIRWAICTFMDHPIDSGLKGLVLGYLRPLSPRMAHTRGSEFPRTLKQHPINHDRSTESSWGNLICHHIGNAILAYYDSLDAGEPTEHLLARVEQLKEIAERPKEFVPYGSVQTGYCLMTLGEIKALETVHRGIPAVPHVKK